MEAEKKFVHPYIPNSAPDMEECLLSAINVEKLEHLHNSIPDNLRLHRRMNLPEPLLSEFALKKHIESILAKNITCSEYINFLGAGCWQHYIPAVCDEINSRAEFLTAYCGDTYSDLGKYQAIFEYQSMMGELLDMEVVSCPTYDWACAASSSLRMAARITKRKEVIVVKTTSTERLLHMKNFFKGVLDIITVDYNPTTGMMSLDDLNKKISSKTAAVYFENPSYLGFIETNGNNISEIAHSNGALSVVGVDPSSLGILAPPSNYGADIVCGDAQPFGNHLSLSGGLCGFIATKDDEEYIAEYPTILISIAPCLTGDGWGFGQCTHERTSYAQRENSFDYIGTSQWLNAITAGVYLSLIGSEGIRDMGKGILQRSQYAIDEISKIKNIKVPIWNSINYKEFIINFDATGEKVCEINKKLLGKSIFGGKDLSYEFPELGQSALYCVTEVHSQDDILALVEALKEVLK